jgi:Flp pilus assembly pilin Flp
MSWKSLPLARRKNGASLVEFGLVTGLVSVVAIGAVLATGTRIQDIFNTADQSLSSAQGGTLVQTASDEPSEPVRPADPYGYMDDQTFLVGTVNADTLNLSDGTYEGAYGRDGDDEINGTSEDEILAGELGNDILNGSTGSDTYPYVLGDGNDRIYDRSYSSIEFDVFDAPTIDLEDVTMSLVDGRDGDLVMTMPDGATVTVINQMYRDTTFEVETFVFSNDVLDADQMRDLMHEHAKPTGVVIGQQMSDNYFHTTAIDGSYTINEFTYKSQAIDALTFVDETADTVKFIATSTPSAETVDIHTSDGDIITMIGMHDSGGNRLFEKMTFSDGSTLDEDEIRHKTMQDSIVFAFENNTPVNGTPFDDTYHHYADTFGSYMISDHTYRSGTIDTLDIADRNLADVTSTYSGGDMIITVHDPVHGNDIITLADQDDSSDDRYFEVFSFLDTTLTSEQMANKTVNDQKASGYVNFPHISATLDHYPGVDGSYTVDPFSYKSQETHTIIFHGITSDEIIASQTGNDALIDVPDGTGGYDRIIIDDQFRSNTYALSHLQFDDVTWDASDLEAAVTP